jgi:hypothetical protein
MHLRAHMHAARCRWIGVRLDAVAAATLLAAALLAMAMRASVRPEILALALAHVLQLTGLMQWFVRQVRGGAGRGRGRGTPPEAF